LLFKITKELRMIKHFLLLLLSISALQSCSQAPATNTATNTTTPAAPAAPKPAAYASTKAGWLVDLDEAYAISAKEGKPILANFTGSDWCGWCKKLDADVFSKPEFQDWAKKNVVLLEVDFPRRMQIPEKNRNQNAALQQALGITGYPTIWVLNMTKDAATGRYNIDQLGKTGYTPTPDQFIATVDKFVNP
jgi:thiol:disulfide interchange protein